VGHDKDGQEAGAAAQPAGARAQPGRANPDSAIESTSAPDGARARVLDTAYALFTRYGIRQIGIDRIIHEAGVAKMSLYRYFPSKDDLALAFLAERHRRWTAGWLRRVIEDDASEPADRTMALFDALDDWFHRSDYEGCSFVRTLHEVPEGPVHDEAVRQLDVVRQMLVEHAAQAGAADPQTVATQMQILMMGAMVSALRGDRDAARHARPLAGLLLEQARGADG
jgi:AcrR family transcriptional regulator